MRTESGICMALIHIEFDEFVLWWKNHAQRAIFIKLNDAHNGSGSYSILQDFDIRRQLLEHKKAYISSNYWKDQKQIWLMSFFEWKYLWKGQKIMWQIQKLPKITKKHIQSCITNHFDPKFCSTRNTRKSSSLNRFALQEKVSNESINKIRSTEIQIWNYGCSYQIWVFLSTFFDFVIFLYDKPVLFAQRWF